MKQWQETSHILGRIAALAERGEQAAVATVVRIEGSAYRRPGAKLLVEESGTTVGGVSGGCLEADVREVGLAVMRDNTPRLRHYDIGSDDNKVWGLGLGCDGTVDVFVQPATSTEALEVFARVRQLLEGDMAFAVSTVLTGQGSDGRSVGAGRALVWADGRAVAGSTGDTELDGAIARQAAKYLAEGQSTLCNVSSVQVFTEIQVPPPRLVIFGAGDDAMSLAASASHVGFRVGVVDHRPAYLEPERFPDATHLINARPGEGTGNLALGPRSYAVVMTHSFAHDRAWVDHLLGTDVSYIGLLGARVRTEKIVELLEGEESDRVFGPVGLDIGADGPEQVAVSIVAELLAVFADREPRHLREREGAIHVF